MQEQDGKSSQSIQSQGQSSTELSLDNVKVRTFSDFPKTGELTVLAYLSKEDYRRQLAGKAAPVWLPEHGLRLGLSYYFPDSLNDLVSRMKSLGKGASSGNSTNHVAEDLDFFWRDWVLGVSYESPAWGDGGLEAASLGWQWVPWATRSQIFVPLRAEVAGVQVGSSYAALSWGAFGGLGWRYWFTDGLAFEAAGLWHQALSSGHYVDGQGQSLQDSAGKDLNFSLTGYQVRLGIVWSGF
jgi:hypothetical protein